MFALIDSCTNLPSSITYIIEQYDKEADDVIINKIQQKVYAFFFTLHIPYFRETEPKIYQKNIDKSFRDALWSENSRLAYKALELGASYLLLKEQILRLVELKKTVALNIFTAQISFERKLSSKLEIKVGGLGQISYFREKRTTYYLDEAAIHFAEAFHESNSQIKSTLSKFYQKYKKRSDSNEPELTSEIYTGWKNASINNAALLTEF